MKGKPTKTKLIVAHNKKLYEISRQCTQISFDDTLNDGASKLTVSLVGNCHFDNGDAIQFVYKGVGIFNGFIFEIEQNRGKEVTIVAHDQLRYCKAKDLIAITNKDTIETLVERMSRYLQLKKGYIEKVKHSLSVDAKTESTWLDVIYEKMSETLKDTHKKYVLRDEFGKLCLRDISNCFMNFIIGDKSLLYDYTYKKSINDDFYNQVKLYAEIDQEEEKGDRIIKSKKLEIVMVRDQTSIQKYGTLQYFEKLSGKTSQIKKAKMLERAKVLLADYNRTKHSFHVSCIGVPEVRAGNVVKVITKELGVNQNHLVKSVSHDFLPVHTMSIEFAELFVKQSGKSKFEIITPKSKIIKISEERKSDRNTYSDAGIGQIEGKAGKVVEIARSFIGKVRYNFGSKSPQNGISDCSGFTQYCYRQVGVEIGGYTGAQVMKGTKVKKENLRAGDLVLFKNTYDSKYRYGVSHVGIYLSNGNFVHCNPKTGVSIDNLSSSYNKQHYLMGRRVL